MISRGAAFAAGIAMLAACVLGALLALLFIFYAAQAPDAFVPDGDPCCATPDTWGEVAAGTVATVVVVGVLACVIALSVALLSWAQNERWPRSRFLASFPIAAIVVLLLGLAAAWSTDTARLRVDCGSFAFRPRDWRTGGSTARLRAAEALSRCHVLAGRRDAEVRRMLGRPTSTRHEGRDGALLLYDDLAGERGTADATHSLTVVLRGGRVRSTRFSASCC